MVPLHTVGGMPAPFHTIPREPARLSAHPADRSFVRSSIPRHRRLSESRKRPLAGITRRRPPAAARGVSPERGLCGDATACSQTARRSDLLS
uniref:Uncharacterized protein n=2 Tax=Aegilops tauschii subsp. strangulata TaxID=200361 RepID=A0A453BIB3_AEGTS